MFKYRFVPQIQMVAIGLLIAAPFNPPSRTAQKALAELVKGIQELGGIAQPIIISSDMRVIDGHRRLAALRAMGAIEVPVIVLPLSLQQAYRILNTTQRPLTAREWGVAVSLGYFHENLPQRVRKDLESLERLLGDTGVELIVERDMAPGVVREALTVARYVHEITARNERPTDDQWRQVLTWMIDQGQQAAAKAAVSDRMSPALLRYAIESNTKLRDDSRRRGR